MNSISKTSEFGSLSPFESSKRSSIDSVPYPRLNSDEINLMITQHFSKQRHSSATVETKVPKMNTLTKANQKDIICKVYGRISGSPKRFKHHIPQQRIKLLHIDKPLLNYNQNTITDSSNSRLNSTSIQRGFQITRKLTSRLREKILLPIARQTLRSKESDTRGSTAIQRSEEIVSIDL